MGSNAIKEAAFDAGPLIHLFEIDGFSLLNLFGSIYITEEVNQETSWIKKPNNIVKKINLNKKSKDFSKALILDYDVDLGEATAIALAKQVNLSLFFTDDLLAREISKQFGLEPHGTIAIIIRCYKVNMISKDKTIDYLKKLKEKSSLFITSDIINDIIRNL